MTKQEKKNLEKLLQLVRKYPELKVIQLVSYEVVPDDSAAWWEASLGEVSVDGYLVDDEGYMFVRSYHDEEEVLSGVLGYEGFEKMSDEEAKKAYEKLEWTEAIMVHIVP